MGGGEVTSFSLLQEEWLDRQTMGGAEGEGRPHNSITMKGRGVKVCDSKKIYCRKQITRLLCFEKKAR